MLKTTNGRVYVQSASRQSVAIEFGGEISLDDDDNQMELEEAADAGAATKNTATAQSNMSALAKEVLKNNLKKKNTQKP